MVPGARGVGAPPRREIWKRFVTAFWAFDERSWTWSGRVLGGVFRGGARCRSAAGGHSERLHNRQLQQSPPFEGVGLRPTVVGLLGLLNGFSLCRQHHR